MPFTSDNVKFDKQKMETSPFVKVQFAQVSFGPGHYPGTSIRQWRNDKGEKIASVDMLVGAEVRSGDLLDKEDQ